MNINRRERIILTSSIILMFSYFFMGRVTIKGSKELLVFSFFKPFFGANPWYEVYQYIYQFLTAFLFLFIIPLIIIRYFLREKPSRFGLQIGDYKLGKRIFILGVIVVIPIMYFFASTPDIQSEYPLSKLISKNDIVLILYEELYLIYYISWEFFFRGYLQLGLSCEHSTRRELLLITSYQTFFSTILHIGKPFSEIMGAAAIGPLFGFIAFQTESALYLIGIHYLIGVTTDLFSLFQLNLL